MPDALGPDDYKMLYGMLTSGDEGQRKQGLQLSSKLTPNEAQSFFDFQHAAQGSNPELNRQDNSLLGMPPELAVASGLGFGSSMAQAAAGGASKAVAATKAAIGSVAPVVKYEATKTVLEKMGLPSPFATVAAMAVAGYRGRGAAGSPMTPQAPPAVDMAGAPSAVSADAVATRLAMKPPPANALPKNTDLGSMFDIPMAQSAAAPTPKMALSADDVVQIKNLVGTGIPQSEAVRRVWNAKFGR